MSLTLDRKERQSVQKEQLTGPLTAFVPAEVYPLENPQTDIPRIAKDAALIRLIEEAVRRIPTKHVLNLGDARKMHELASDSVHLVLTSPPYWTLKEYRNSAGQMGHISDYEEFLSELDKVWAHCLRTLVPGGRLICVVGDVCLSRRKNNGRHTVVPLHASIQEHCRRLGFDNLAPIIWHKIANAVYEVENGSSFLGKPYEPNSVIKNDIEFILMERKPGGYRTNRCGNESFKRHLRGESQGVVPANLVWFDGSVDALPPGPLPCWAGGTPYQDVQFRRRHCARSLPGHGLDNGGRCPNGAQ
jgi:hypothetical protein